MRRREASINDAAIGEAERRIFGPRGAAQARESLPLNGCGATLSGWEPGSARGATSGASPTVKVAVLWMPRLRPGHRAEVRSRVRGSFGSMNNVRHHRSWRTVGSNPWLTRSSSVTTCCALCWDRGRPLARPMTRDHRRVERPLWRPVVLRLPGRQRLAGTSEERAPERALLPAQQHTAALIRLRWQPGCRSRAPDRSCPHGRRRATSCRSRRRSCPVPDRRRPADRGRRGMFALS